MRTIVALLAFASMIKADSPYPEQFYTNGAHMDVWRKEPDRRSILFFEKEPGDKIVYKQVLIVALDGQPDYAYSIDGVTKKFVGRYNYKTGRYSLLPADARRERLEDIPANAFPPAGDMPKISEIIEGSQNRNRMIEPPVTTAYPKLDSGTWDTNYYTIDKKKVRAKIYFRARGSTFEIEVGGKKEVGALDPVKHETAVDGTFVITGRWAMLGQQGTFRFNISDDNLNQFQGEWTRNGQLAGTWLGTRVREE